MTPKAREHRFRRLKEMGCVCCWMLGYMNVPPEIHHLNLDGKAGQKRRGDEFTIPLCPWHHQAHTANGHSANWYEERFGPSLKTSSRAFRQEFGTDNALLERVDNHIRMIDEYALAHHKTEAEKSL